MATVREVRQRVQQGLDRVTEIAGEAILEHKEEIVALLVYQQQEQNEDSAGNPLRQYSAYYEHLKKQMGKSGKPDLDLTGEFQGGMNLAIVDNTFVFESPAQTAQGELKSDWLNRWNRDAGGVDVMRLSDDKKPEVWRIIQPTFAVKFKGVSLLG